MSLKKNVNKFEIRQEKPRHKLEMQNEPKHVELNNLLQGYPSMKPGQENRAWKRLRDKLYPKPDIIGMPKRFSWNLWGGMGVGSMAVIAVCACCWYEVLSPFGMDNHTNAPSVVPASFKVPASGAGRTPATEPGKDQAKPAT